MSRSITSHGRTPPITWTRFAIRRRTASSPFLPPCTQEYQLEKSTHFRTLTRGFWKKSGTSSFLRNNCQGLALVEKRSYRRKSSAFPTHISPLELNAQNRTSGRSVCV